MINYGEIFTEGKMNDYVILPVKRLTTTYFCGIITHEVEMDNILLSEDDVIL